jgi:hypothetical protein
MPEELFKFLGNPIKKPSTSKDKRRLEISIMEDVFIWNSLAEEKIKEDLSKESFHKKVLESIEKEYKKTGISKNLFANSLVDVALLQSIVKLQADSISRLFKSYATLQEIEKMTSAGGRPPNKEIFKIASKTFEDWKKRKGKNPSASALSKQVEKIMQSINGTGKGDGTLYLSERTARSWIKRMANPMPGTKLKDLINNQPLYPKGLLS